jgi:hypothetical protein
MAEQEPEPSQTMPKTSETSGFNASEDSQQAKDMLEILNNCEYHNLRFYYDREYNFNPRNFINI